MPKVLVADDSITVRKVAERLLTEAGMEVALAASGEEAMAYLSTEHPDFIISDVIMPDKSGYDVCRFVRSQAMIADTPVLLISGIVNDEVNRQAESCRANGVLKKPFQGASLQDRVRDILSRQMDKEAPAAETPSSAAVSSLEVNDTPSQDQTVVASGAKAYRITEEQLKSFRESAGRIKELERLMEEEKANSARLTQQLETAAQGQGRIADMEASLAEYQRKIEDLSVQTERFTGIERRNLELESLVTELRNSNMAAPERVISNGNHATVAELQTLLSDQQRRLSELAHEVMTHGQSGEQVRTLEAALSVEKARASSLAVRCTDLEQELVRANGRLDECTTVLQKIGRLAAKPEEER